jgi:hydroxymethylpyrimidine pyrophosphatase-like HAD family hydrolase
MLNKSNLPTVLNPEAPFSRMPAAASAWPTPEETTRFFAQYDWTLYPSPDFLQASDLLQIEVDRLQNTQSTWQRNEHVTNIWLLASGMLHRAEEYERGTTLALPAELKETWPARTASGFIDFMANNWAALGHLAVRKWRKQWLSALIDYNLAFVVGDTDSCAGAANKMLGISLSTLPKTLLSAELTVPSPFRRLDLTHHDVIELANRLCRTLGGYDEKVVLVGLRTSGSYFTPLMSAVLQIFGIAKVAIVNFEPGKLPGRWERQDLREFATAGYRPVIVDDPPHSGGTILSAARILQSLGFAAERLIVAAPTHSAGANWQHKVAPIQSVDLAPQDWFKNRQMAGVQDGQAMAQGSGIVDGADVCLELVPPSSDLLSGNDGNSGDPRTSHLKTVYRLSFNAKGKTKSHIAYVVAKSVGWGWLSYHAFIVAQRLAGQTPRMLTLTNGILYSEFLPTKISDLETDRPIENIEQSLADYVASRSVKLKLPNGGTSKLDLHRHNTGTRLLEAAISRNYAKFPVDILTRSRIRAALAPHLRPDPILIDGAMLRENWLLQDGHLLKTDFEHHGQGKGAVNLVDSAFDLAGATLAFGLSQDEQSKMLDRYIQKSGDVQIASRILLNSLAAGLWYMYEAQQRMMTGHADSKCQWNHHRLFISSWHFLTVLMARFCGGLFGPILPPTWHGPLIFLDIDGVIDLRLMGFPSPTYASAVALRKLSVGGFSVALNSARSAAEIREYCAAYGLAGGVGEHGTYLWNAVSHRGTSLIDDQARAELNTLRAELRKLPNHFFDERHESSVRASVYVEKPKGIIAQGQRSMRLAECGDGALAPLPRATARRLIADLNLKRLEFHSTEIDTTFTVKGFNKGTGLIALRNSVLGPEAVTVAVGDQEPDLEMFSHASASYAPSHIAVVDRARLLNCKISSKPYQAGFAEITNDIIAHFGKSVAQPILRSDTSASEYVIIEALKAADARGLLRALGLAINARSLGIFFR